MNERRDGMGGPGEAQAGNILGIEVIEAEPTAIFESNIAEALLRAQEHVLMEQEGF